MKLILPILHISMIKIFLLCICIVPTVLINAQIEVLDKYPYGQDFYAGGRNQLNKEMVKVVKEQKLLSCEKSEEQYDIQILVNKDSSINYVKDFDSVKINNNKCAFDFSRKIIPYLKRWIPAKENGSYVAAIATISIQPFYLYHSKDDPSKNESKSPTYKRGMENFSEEIKSIFQDKLRKNENRSIELIFTVNEYGDMQDFIVTGDFSERDKKDVIRSLSKIKGKWNPATFNGIALRTKLRQPITQYFDFQLEQERVKSMDQKMFNSRY